ncbi:dihydrofolate reductase family protein [Saccharopolyspora aridisoli]|uniref:dihydrofolate reductase family protein n=1 Tax=Saccharopolyspora aridisoli TaxID=2530385 RepID=UPI001F2ED2DC|nr:dihydrofolate reductase family protein [Saccharopolyspora aridisoli]
MSDLMVDFIISLDGYAAAEGWPGSWWMEGPEHLGWIGSESELEHVTLMGATTYRLMSGFAAEAPEEAGLAELTAMPKVVFSSTLKAPLTWANSDLVTGDAVEAVRELKQRNSPARTVGSLGLSRRCSKPGSWTASAWSSSRSSPARPARNALRRLPGHRARPDQRPHLRRPAPAARVRPHDPRRPARRVIVSDR